ncbi:DUF461 domain-containing protein [Kitasatospora sp. SUK 42]|uniref:DUF461 domain-containing protein n=1 Tax=Kitasatospora sp. SUK 42 TaxID=1588882 RepID=UPI0018CA2D94|nr:DUF461 domain-containing protein [Kitasatospora sp. SUK 42]MBV2154651.1 DUF461 domain-containing protein [Kitasatospora sp. SUK 42]
MSRSLRRGSIAAIAAIAIASLSSCAAGNTPDTLQIKPDNAAATIGTNLRLNNIVIVTGAGTTGDHTGPANVVLNIANTANTPAELQSITVGDNAAPATFEDAAGAPLSTIVVPAGGSVVIGGQGNPSATAASASVHIGGFAKTVFTFKDGQKVETQAAVSPDASLYKGFGPTPTAAAVPAKPATPGATAAATVPVAGATTPGAPVVPGAPTTGAATPSGAATPGVPAAH